MLKVSTLYRPYHKQVPYANVEEENILKRFYKFSQGTVEEVIARIINQAVLEHMDFTVDSTIMQMLSLNDYLSKLFMSNFSLLIYNNCLYYLENKQITEISEETAERISELSKTVTMKTELKDIWKMMDKMDGIVP